MGLLDRRMGKPVRGASVPTRGGLFVYKPAMGVITSRSSNL